MEEEMKIKPGIVDHNLSDHDRWEQATKSEPVAVFSSARMANQYSLVSSPIASRPPAAASRRRGAM